MLDAVGMLHNGAYLLLFERARTDFWRAQGMEMGSAGMDWPYYVARNEVNYRAAIYEWKPVTVTVAIERIGRTSVTFLHTVQTAKGVVAAEGKTVLVRVDAETKRPIPWSEGFRALLERFLLPNPPF
jgi:acyl-CoA thioester hydrolase